MDDKNINIENNIRFDGAWLNEIKPPQTPGDVGILVIQLVTSVKSAVGMLSHARDQEEYDDLLNAVAPRIGTQLAVLRYWWQRS